MDNYLEGYHVPIAHPGLMRLLDYKNYDVEVHDNWIWFEAPLREKPSGNVVERTYQRLVTPMAGLSEEDTRVSRYILIYPNTTIDLYPDQVGIWQINPDGPLRTRDVALTLLPGDSSFATRAARYANRKVNELVSDEDVDLVANVQAGIESRGWEPGPLSGMREWLADGITAGIEGGAFDAGADPERVADRLMALADGYGVRVLIGELDIEHARREIWAGLAAELGLPASASV